MSFRDRVAGLQSPGAVHMRREGAVAVLSLDHPGARNALSPGMMVQLGDRVAALATAMREVDGPRAVVVGGVGPAFCAGGDLAAVQAHLLVPGAAREMQAFMREVCDGLAALPGLVIGAVEGAALGGGAELLTACDLVIACPTARVGFVQALMGVSPGFGGGRRLVDRVGRARAIDLLTRALPVGAMEAMRLGVVDEIAEDAWGRAMQRATEASTLPREAGAAVKPLVAGLFSRQTGSDPEAETFERLWGGPEHVAAIERFRRR